MTAEPTTYLGRLRLAGRLARLGAHVGTGFALSLASGAMFLPHRAYQLPVIRYWHRGLCRVLRTEVRVHGTPDPRPALWISNHVSWLDIPVIGAHFPVYFLSKSEVASWPLVGQLANSAGTLYIRRGQGDSGTVAEQMASHLSAGRSILFFPEGTTTDGQQLKTFFHRLFQAACVTGADIQPVVLCYRDEHGKPHLVAPFVGDDEFTDHLLRVLHAQPIHVDLLVLPRVSVAGRDARTLSKALREQMAAALQQLQNQEVPISR